MSRLRGSLWLAAALALVPAVPAPGQPTNRSEVTALFFPPAGKGLPSPGPDGRVHRHDPATGQEEKGAPAHQDGVWGAALSPDGKRLATAGGDGRVRLWDAATLEPLRDLRGHQNEVIAVAFTPDGKTLAS